MNSLVFILCLTISWVEAQNGRGQHQDHTGHGWDIRLAVPGEPGNDYPTLGAIPRTTFSCAGKEPGYYADLETNCQVFRVCTVGSTYGFQSFLCPNGTLFNQAVFVCDWWMNVNCQSSPQFFPNNNQKFENLRLGPQLMKDIKKMLTHPMRNPLNKNAMKSNLIVMQDYKPPFGQLFPNGALIAGPDRPPNNVYVPTKFINQFNPSNPHDFASSASTPEPRYLPGKQFNPELQNVEVFQRQRQSGQYVENSKTQPSQTLQSGNFISNGHAGRYIQNSNTGISQLPRPAQIINSFPKQSNIADTSKVNSEIQKTGLNRQRAQYTEPRKLNSSSNRKQANIGGLPTRSQNIQSSNNNQDKQAYTYSTPSPDLPQFSNTVHNAASGELKQNLALVYSFLADSINVAREYRNLATQEALSSTSAPVSQFQNHNSEDLSQITNKVSQLTSSQYSNYNNINNRVNIVSNKRDSTNPVTQFTSNTIYTNAQNQPRQVQNQPYSSVSQQPQQPYSSRFESAANIQSIANNQNQIYSGQLYQWPVPEVTNKIYNRQTSADEQSTQMLNLQETGNVMNTQNSFELSNPNFEIIKANTILFDQDKFQLEPPSAPAPFASQESTLNSDNTISAHLQDKIVGTISHPSDANKLLTYKKDQSYYLYTKLDENSIENVPTGRQANIDKNTKESQGTAQDVLSFQLIPSISYELEDEKEKEKLFNTFRIDEFGAPRDIVRSKNTANINQSQDLSTNVDTTVVNLESNKQMEQVRLKALYNGPSSYSAPQSSVGSLETRQVIENNLNSRLEDLDNTNSEGYTKERSTREFTY